MFIAIVILLALSAACDDDASGMMRPDSGLIPFEVENVVVFPKQKDQRDDVTIEAVKDPLDFDRYIKVKGYCPVSCVKLVLQPVDPTRDYELVKGGGVIAPLFNKWDRTSCRAPGNNDRFTCFLPNQTTRVCNWSYIPINAGPGFYKASFLYNVDDPDNLNSAGQKVCDFPGSEGIVYTRQIIEIPQ